MKATVKIINGERWLEEVNPYFTHPDNNEFYNGEQTVRGVEFRQNHPLILTSDTSLQSGDIVNLEDYDIVWQCIIGNNMWKDTDSDDKSNIPLLKANEGLSTRQIAHRKSAQHPVEEEWKPTPAWKIFESEQQSGNGAEGIAEKVMNTNVSYHQLVAKIKTYGRQCVEADRKDATEKARINPFTGQISKDSILNRPIKLI